MRFLLAISLLIGLGFTTIPAIAQSAQPPKKFSVFGLSPYDPRRTDYESFPVLLSGVGGGKLAPNEKLEIFALAFRNTTLRNITAIRVSYYVFKTNKLDDVIESGQTGLIPFELPASELRKVRIHILDADELPSLDYKQGEEFRLELAVTEVHFSDGSIWQATNMPGKITPIDVR